MSEKSIAAARRRLADEVGQRATFVADPHVVRDAGGGEIVHFQQSYAGIPFFGGQVAVHLGDGAILGTVREAPDLDCVPSLSPEEAAAAALRHFAPRSDRSVCQAPHRSRRGAVPPVEIAAMFPLPTRPTVLALPRTRSSPLAHLEIHEQRLVWVVRLPFRVESYLLLVLANGEDAGEVRLCAPWSSGARCTGRVFGFDGVDGTQQFPVPPSMFPAPLLHLPNATLLADWIDVDATIGNNVVTHFRNPETLVRATGGVFPAALNQRDQALLNAFFFCNYLHDFFLLLGFGEREGNFQLRNAPGNPGGGDRLMVKFFAQDFEPHLGVMEARIDGDRAVMRLGLARNGEPAPLHADVVIHEYAHGVSQRMVGGRRGAASLLVRQSLALAEAWSDYFAITLRNHHLAHRDYRFAAWSGSAKRSAAYDLHYSGHYGLLGRPPHDTPHGAGEIFAVALIRFNEFLGEALVDATAGNCLGWRIVVESLRQCHPDNPTLLQGREAVFKAITKLAANQITAAEAAAAHDAARRAFAKYGMGPNASGPASTAYGPTTPDMNP